MVLLLIIALLCSFNRKDATNEDERAINLIEEIYVDYQGWFHNYMERTTPKRALSISNKIWTFAITNYSPSSGSFP